MMGDDKLLSDLFEFDWDYLQWAGAKPPELDRAKIRALIQRSYGEIMRLQKVNRELHLAEIRQYGT